MKQTTQPRSVEKDIPDLPPDRPATPEMPGLDPSPAEKPATPERPEVMPGKEPVTPIYPPGPGTRP